MKNKKGQDLHAAATRKMCSKLEVCFDTGSSNQAHVVIA